MNTVLCQVPLALQKEAVIRRREVEVGEEEREARIAQMKDWQRFTIKRHSNELWHMDKVLKAQNAALEELRAENESLYEAAIQFDPNLPCNESPWLHLSAHSPFLSAHFLHRRIIGHNEHGDLITDENHWESNNFTV